jgi:hypothetical protein
MKFVERNQGKVQRPLRHASSGGRCKKESDLKGKDFYEFEDYPYLDRQLIDNA